LSEQSEWRAGLDEFHNTYDSAGGKSLLYSWSSTTGYTGTDPTFSFNAHLTTNPGNPAAVTFVRHRSDYQQ